MMLAGSSLPAPLLAGDTAQTCIKVLSPALGDKEEKQEEK